MRNQIFSVVGLLSLLGCSEVGNRNNITDPSADNYSDEASSSSLSNTDVSSSSSSSGPVDLSSSTGSSSSETGSSSSDVVQYSSSSLDASSSSYVVQYSSSSLDVSSSSYIVQYSSSSLDVSSSSYVVQYSSSSLDASSSSDVVQYSSSSLDVSSSSSPQSSSSTMPCATGSFDWNTQLCDMRDGKIYGKAAFGSQVWMTQNLNYGEQVTGSYPDVQDSRFEKTCYGDFSANCDLYGGLYQWAEAMGLFSIYNSTSATILAGNTKGVCPTDWHIPSATEWDALANYLGGSFIAGKTMKKTNTSNATWDALLNNDGNSSGFSALPGGYRYWDYGFNSLGGVANFWETTENSSTPGSRAIYRQLDASSNDLLLQNQDKAAWFSVRCVHD